MRPCRRWSDGVALGHRLVRCRGHRRRGGALRYQPDRGLDCDQYGHRSYRRNNQVRSWGHCLDRLVDCCGKSVVRLSSASRHQQMTFGQRFLLTLIIIIIILFALAAFGYFTGRWGDDAEAQSAYVVTKYELRLLELEREAVDDAFKQKITSLWTVWMSDERGQPGRAVTGATQARKAYIASMQELDKREEEYKRGGK